MSSTPDPPPRDDVDPAELGESLEADGTPGAPDPAEFGEDLEAE